MFNCQQVFLNILNTYNTSDSYYVYNIFKLLSFSIWNNLQVFSNFYVLDITQIFLNITSFKLISNIHRFLR